MPENRVFDELEDGSFEGRWLDEITSDSAEDHALAEAIKDAAKADPRFEGKGIDDLIGGIRALVENDLAHYEAGNHSEPPHPLVIQCLHACIDQLSAAKTAYYASLK